MMKNWLRNAASNASKRRNQLWPSSPSDSFTIHEAFLGHWTQAKEVMNASKTDSTADNILTVFKHVEQMINLLITESNSQEKPTIGPILDEIFVEDVLSEVVKWSLSVKTRAHIPITHLQLLRAYEDLVARSIHCLLVHKPILLPLLELVQTCSYGCSFVTADIEKHFVLLLNQICIKIAHDSTLLEFFFNRSTTLDGPRFLIFTLLIPYLYEEGDIGQLARDALLLVLTVSQKVEPVGHFIGEHSNFCPVLATGLSACFSQLPRQLSVSDDWHRITMQDVDAIPEVQSFYSALVFCNAVVQVGHDFVLEQLLDYMYQGFLVPVVGPALCEGGLSLNELITGTAYLELCFRIFTEPPLKKILVKFVLSTQFNGKRILDTLVERINSKTRLCLVSLAFFHTLIDLNCEDLILELVLKYFLPCTHLMVSQLPNLQDVDYYGRIAEEFLSLMPSYSHSSPLSSALTNGDMDDSFDSSDSMQSTAYLEYLSEARSKVQSCYLACTSSWSMPYDGETPDPELYQDELSPPATDPDSPERLDGRFRRHSSLRRSRPNSYFTRKHTSLGIPSGSAISAVDLSVLGPEEFDNSFLDPFQNFCSSPQGSGSLSSSTSTPRFRRDVSMPTADYFKLAFEYDEDETVLAPAPSNPSKENHSTGGEESEGSNSASNTEGGEGFVLRGWSEVQDLNTFIEVLNRVRTSQPAAQATLEENLRYIDRTSKFLTKKLHEKLPSVSDNQLEESPMEETQLTSESQENALVASKDSGLGNADSMEGWNTTSGSDSVGVTTETEVNNPPSPSAATIPVHIKGDYQHPNIGPLMTILLKNMEGMGENGLFVNLQLTGVLSRLAVYPQPLLFSFLTNTSLVFQPGIRSLFQVLRGVKQTIEKYATRVNNFDALVLRGRKFLCGREKKFLNDIRHRSGSHMISASLNSSGFNSLAESSSFSSLGINLLDIAGPEAKVRSNSDLFGEKRISSDAKSRSSTATDSVGKGPKARFYQHKLNQKPEATLELINTRNMVYCTIVLEEFVKELAAIIQEHALLSETDRSYLHHTY